SSSRSLVTFAAIRGDRLRRDQQASALFGFASGLGPRRGDAANLFEPTRSTLAAELVPRPTDNLGYMDASVVRWMAAVSNDTVAKQMAECLIARNLYKEVLLFSAADVPTFLKTAFTKSRKGYEGALEATEWLRLLDHLKIALKGYLSSGESMITIDDNGLPSLLVDVAIPKTMRTQAELRVLDNDIGSATTWKRVKRIDAQKGWLLGLRVAQSPIYDAYGGQSEDLAPLQVRVFARPGLAQDLRPRLEGTVAQSWLETFRI
ncbi:MAG TPA: hypothetical protein VHT91_48000, partial [Kofleriaceae bacterium]|nr:hypothetical protein [Kofleriaceae bacterium]